MKKKGKSKAPKPDERGTAHITSPIKNYPRRERSLPSRMSTSACAGTPEPQWCQSDNSTPDRLPAKKYKCNSYNLSRGRKHFRHKRPLHLRRSALDQRTETPEDQNESDQNQRETPQFVSETDITSCKQLHYGAYIGNETRTIEFKSGSGNYMRDNLHDDVCKYGCAFLNSGGGSLLIGVGDDGVVCGVSFSHTLEDKVSQKVDFIVNKFDPPLLPQNYSLHFLPVIKENKNNLKVLRLTFKAPLAFSEPTLFQIDQGKVYIRRDGSLHGPLSSSVILEWCRQMWATKVQKLEQHLHEAVSERWFLAGQVQSLLHMSATQQATVNLLLQQHAAHVNLQSSLGQNSPASSSLSPMGAYEGRG